MTRYITFTISEEYKQIEPVLDVLKHGRVRSDWICKALLQYMNAEETKMVISGVKDIAK